MRFRALLDSELDPTRLTQLQKLLIAEEDKLGATSQRVDDIEREIAKSKVRIEWQQALVASMERDGRDATVAKRVLDNLIQIQAMYCEYRQSLLAVLDRNRL